MNIPYLLHIAPAWLEHAACGDADPEDFFPKKGDHDAIRRARAVCGVCPVRAKCLDYALNHEDSTSTTARFGIYGGTSAYERRRVLSARKASA